MKEHLINTPAENSYQAQTRKTIEPLITIFKQCRGTDEAKAMEIFNQVQNELDFMAWRSDKQVQALKDEIQWRKDNTWA